MLAGDSFSPRDSVAMSRRRVATPVPDGVTIQVGQFVDILKLTCRMQADGLGACGDFTGAGNHIKPAEQGRKLVQRNAGAPPFWSTRYQC
ncbi:Uncharacterised protein [Enterobacter cancerogenus]|uniref:Uncharacterized protein n=1 Tax=Enterobacter cancerogenus TaxID=69218 RepID=A0A484XM46_9ENTR|nr:Uncharacterised protein [Enterobacter cancerogenus]